MEQISGLAARFEEHRSHLLAVAYRMLGSLAEAEDAVQEAWLHASRADTDEVRNLAGWLTTVVARVCLDQLRSRASRREDPVGDRLPESAGGYDAADPQQEAELADSVGLALLVVLDRLAPAERLAFVLHDLFAVPFEEIAPVVGRSPAAARQLASRARRRVRGADRVPGDVDRQRAVVEAFQAAARGGDLAALVALLDPDVQLRVGAAGPAERARTVRGAAEVAGQALTFSRAAPFAHPVLVGNAVGVVVAPLGRANVVLAFTVAGDRVAAIDVVTDPARIRELELAVLDD